jgi:hypothetical protein
MDLLATIPFELKEVIFIEITDHEDLLRVYDSGVFNDIFNNTQSWARKFRSNFPIIYPGLFSVPIRVISRIVKYRIMIDALMDTYNLITDLEESIIYQYNLNNNEMSSPSDIIFLPNHINSASTMDFEFLQLSNDVLEIIDRELLRYYPDMQIHIGRKVANILSDRREYLLKISLPRIDPPFEIIEIINPRILFSYYFMGYLYSVKIGI